MSQPAALLGEGFQIRFERRADRYVQLIEVDQGRGFECIAESIEGAADELWPPSPPLQDLHIEQREGGVQVALLVGRAGRSHWSLSIELDSSSREVQFDVACRTTERPSWLGSSYRLTQPSCLGIECGLGSCAERSKDQLVISATLDGISNQTIRWRYRLIAAS